MPFSLPFTVALPDILALVSLWLLLLILGGLLLILGIFAVGLAPVVARRVASRTTRPKLERRASGPDRMRVLINAQRTERKRRSSLATGLTRAGVILFILAIVSLVAGGVTWYLGY